MFWSISLAMILSLVQGESVSTSPSEAHLREGHYRLTVTIEDSTNGRGVADIAVQLKLRRGFLFLGRKKRDLRLTTDRSGKVQFHGLPAGKLELLLFVEKDRPQKYKTDLKPGLGKSVQLHAGRFSMLIEWKLF